MGYTPAFSPEHIVKGKLIELQKFLEDVKKASDEFLEHHGTVYNDYFAGTVPVTYPTSTELPAQYRGPATTGMFAWAGGNGADKGAKKLDEIKGELSTLRDDFKKNVQKIVRAQVGDPQKVEIPVWGFLSEYFYRMCRIAKQRFSYYPSKAEGLATKEYLGFIALGDKDYDASGKNGCPKRYYASLDDYRKAVDYVRQEAEITGPVGSAPGAVIGGLNTANAIRGLMTHNAYTTSGGGHELVYDHGTRNKIWTWRYFTGMQQNMPPCDSEESGKRSLQWISEASGNCPTIRDTASYIGVWDDNWQSWVLPDLARRFGREKYANNLGVMVDMRHSGYHGRTSTYYATAQRIRKSETILVSLSPTTSTRLLHGGSAYSLTMQSSNAEFGSVAIMENGSWKYGDGTYAFQKPTAATIMAEAADSHKFDKWSDGISDSRRTVMVDGEKDLVALFDCQYVTVTALASPENIGGSVAGSGEYPVGTAVKLNTSIRDELAEFINWDNDKSLTATALELTATRNETHTAYFKRLKYLLAVKVADGQEDAGSVGIDDGVYGPSSTKPMNIGETAKIGASASDGYAFDKWDDGNTNNPRTVTVAGDATYVASFKAKAS